MHLDSQSPIRKTSRALAAATEGSRCQIDHPYEDAYDLFVPYGRASHKRPSDWRVSHGRVSLRRVPHGRAYYRRASHGLGVHLTGMCLMGVYLIGVICIS